MLDQSVAAGSGSRLPVDLAVAPGGTDEDMVVAHQERKVGVAALQGDRDAMRSIRLDRLDSAENSLCRGLGIVGEMMPEGVDDIPGVERLAVVELDALANLEHPRLRVRGGVPALRQLRNQLTRGRHLGQVVADLAEQYVDHVGIQNEPGVQDVAGRATRGPDAQPTALLRRRPCLVEHGRCRGCRQTERDGCRHEVTTTDPPRSDGRSKPVDLVHRLPIRNLGDWIPRFVLIRFHGHEWFSSCRFEEKGLDAGSWRRAVVCEPRTCRGGQDRGVKIRMARITSTSASLT